MDIAATICCWASNSSVASSIVICRDRKRPIRYEYRGVGAIGTGGGGGGDGASDGDGAQRGRGWGIIGRRPTTASLFKLGGPPDTTQRASSRYTGSGPSKVVVPPAEAAAHLTKGEDRRHVHVRLGDPKGSVLDLITEYLQAAGKAPDWYWRMAGRMEDEHPDDVDDLLVAAFEAGAFLAHEHPEDLRFDWVSEEECERERKEEERDHQGDESRKDRSSWSHYA